MAITNASQIPVTGDECKGNAPAVAFKTAQSITGRGAYLLELLSGVQDSSKQLTPTNPQGKIGIDRSGPPWGSAIKHTLWQFEGNSDQSNIYGENLNNLELSSTGAGKDSLNSLKFNIKFWVRPFAVRPNCPYSRAYMSARIITVGGGTANLIFELSRTEDADGLYRQTSVAVTSTGTGNAFASSTSLYTDVQPGMNTRTLRVYGSSFTGGSTGAKVMLMGLHQIVRLSH